MSEVLPPGAAQASSTRCPGSRLERKRDALRAEILHRHDAVGKAGQLRDIARRVELHGLRNALLGVRGNTRRAQESRGSVRGRARRLFTRSHIGACASPAASNCVQRTGQSARSRSASQIGEACRAAGLRAISASSVLRSRK